MAVLATAAHADPGDDYLARLATTVRARLDAIVAAKAPKLVPPVAIAPKWQVTKVDTIDLGAPLVALLAAELDGDRKAGELYAVTAREVVALGYRKGRLVPLGRIAFSGDRAVPEPRDVVGTVVVEGKEIVAAASPWVNELRVTWNGKKLVAVGTPAPGFTVCPGERAQLATGRNHFSNGTYNVRCRDDLVDAQGYPLRVRAELSTNSKLAVTVKRCAPAGDACKEIGKYEYPKVGVAFEIADVDRDGMPEVIVSEASAPDAEDSVKVITLGGDDRRGRFKKSFQGGVAGLVTVDGDDPDDVPEVLAAVRFQGISRLDVWRLD
ncbi:MAG: hypothetical protein ABI867_26880 [Kofleriaceae bacterium]